nr:hypothetical protein [Tanacetum cinerariifolium]
SEEDVFMLSLICNAEAECEKLLTCNIDIGFINVLKYDTEHEQNKTTANNQTAAEMSKPAGTTSKNTKDSKIMEQQHLVFAAT